MEPGRVREATEDERSTWDAITVDAPGGHVFQSTAWATHCATTGWHPRLLASDAGLRVLALERSWPLIGGGSVYLSRGPVPGAVGGVPLADALVATCEVLGSLGADVVAADPEVPAADVAFTDALSAAGFRQIEEIQPSRHRISLPLGPSADEQSVFAGIARSTRQRIRQAEGTVRVTRFDRRWVATEDDPFERPVEPVEAALDRFADLLSQTGERRGFRFPREDFVGWWRVAHAAGHLVLLEARDDDDRIAGLLLYRHGGRLSTAHSADRADLRRRHPGALHLLRWRAIQLAIVEGCEELDLGGADVTGARRPPREGEPTYGLYQHKLSFGGRWVELAGAHELVIRSARYAAGRMAAAALRRVVARRPADGSLGRGQVAAS